VEYGEYELDKRARDRVPISQLKERSHVRTRND
jgi:hypothetical protein